MKAINKLYDDMHAIKREMRIYPQKNDFARRKAVLRLQTKIMELNKINEL